MVFSYANAKHTEREIMGAIPFTIASKISWDNSNQGCDGLKYSEIFKILKKLKKTPGDGKTFHSHGSGGFIV